MEHLKLDSPPTQSRVMIEASAGTGKTYSISKLVIHEILGGLTIDEICVVTFTVAATQELRERIREDLIVLKDALFRSKNKFELNEEQNDAITTFGVDPNSPETLQKTCTALTNFDQASVFTIHGLCQRLVQENAFESGVLFDVDLITDTSMVTEQICRDFIRDRLYLGQEHPTYKSIFPSEDTLKKIIQQSLGSKTMILHPSTELPFEDIHKAMEPILISLCAIGEQFALNTDEIYELLWGKGSPISGTYYKKNSWPSQSKKLIQTLMDPINAKTTDLDLVKKFSLDTLDAPEAKTKAHASTPIYHKALEQLNGCAEKILDLQNLSHQAKAAVIQDFMSYARKQYKRAKDRAGVQGFDDFVIQCRHATIHNPKFVEIVRSKFKVAMVDEFQDTDKFQFDIFYHIFGQSETHRLIMIGDPKQSIYGFRGADIQTYLEAKTLAEGHYTLGENYRSNPKLVDITNAFFAHRTKLPFALEGIDFMPVEAKAHRGELVRETEKPLFEINWEMGGKDSLDKDSKSKGSLDKDSMNKDQLTKVNLRRCAQVIAEHLRAPSSISKDGELSSVQPADIAVLCFKHDHLALVKEYLSELGVNAVRPKSGNVFNSAEATGIEKFITAIIRPSEDRIKSFFFHTLRYSSSEIHEMHEDDMAEHVNRFRDYARQWPNKGVVSIVEKMMEDYELRRRMVRGGIAERYLTNISHLAELLGAEYELNKSLDHLVSYMEDQRDESNEAHEQRLESDQSAVKLMTIHGSKGLQFPLVFCPDLFWRSFEPHQPQVLIYGSESLGPGKKIINVVPKSASWEEDLIGQKIDALREHLRLIYVALTRAVHFQWIGLGHSNMLEKSSLSWFFSNESQMPGASLCSKDELKSALQIWCKKVGATFTERETAPPIRYPSVSTPMESKGRLSTKGPLKIRVSQRGISSFSSLTKYSSESHTPYQETQEIPVAQPKPGSIHDFPRGPKIGDCFHEMFEDLDFTKGEQIKSLCEKKLKKYSLDKDYQGNEVLTQRLATTTKMVKDVLNSQQGDFRLKDISLSQRKSEMEFYFKISKLSAPRLANIFKFHGSSDLTIEYAQRLKMLSIKLTNGFMTGLIDLVFKVGEKYHVLDWKSNYLGPTAEDYRDLQSAMVSHNYLLQAHIYILALHMALKKRMENYNYDEHIGGAHYVFLRGVTDEDPKLGWFHDKPPKALIEALEHLVIEGEDDEAY
jgi:exodeoxyribonuclease V beta subunit